MKSTVVWALWLVLAALGALGLADALQSTLKWQTPYVWSLAYAAAMAALPGYFLLQRKRVQWPILFLAVAVVSAFAGSLLLVRSATVPEGSAFLAMGISIFVAGLVRGFKSA